MTSKDKLFEALAALVTLGTEVLRCVAVDSVPGWSKSQKASETANSATPEKEKPKKESKKAKDGPKEEAPPAKASGKGANKDLEEGKDEVPEIPEDITKHVAARIAEDPDVKQKVLDWLKENEIPKLSDIPEEDLPTFVQFLSDL